MTPKEALEMARAAARLRQLRFADPHAYERMQERGATQSDVAEAIKTATAVKPSPDGPNRWRILGGADFEANPLNVIITIEGHTVTVITLVGD